MTPSPNIPDKTRIAEISAVLATALGKFIFMDYLDFRTPFIILATIGWLSYIIYRSKTKPGLAKYWGFRTDNFLPVLKIVLPFGILSVIAFFIIGYYQGTIHISWTIIPILVLYPIWGTIQQFLLIGLTTGNLQDMQGFRMNKALIVFVAALLFGGIHYPFTWLMIGSFVLAIFYGWVYLRQRNLYVLGIFHGWLGGLFYYTVMTRDPWLEFVEKIKM